MGSSWVDSFTKLLIRLPVVVMAVSSMNMARPLNRKVKAISAINIQTQALLNQVMDFMPMTAETV